MLIFVMPTSYPNEENPVANSFIREQVKAISRKNSDIVVLNVRKQPTSRFFKWIDKRVSIENDGVSDIVFRKQKTFLEKYFVWFNHFLFRKAMKDVYLEAVKKYGVPDIIYAHFYDAGYTALKITKGHNIPIVVLEHSGLLISNKLDARVKKILKYTVENCDEYIVTTSGLKKYAKMHTGTKKDLKLIPNMIDDIFVFHPAVKKEKFEFFSVSRFDYDKRLDLMVEAFCQAFSQEDKVALSIGGNGKEYHTIEKLIKEKGRTGQIKLLGQLDRESVLEKMVRSDAFVLPSRHETFGLVWREALSVGRPVITTDHGGFSEADWNSTFGVMTPVDDKEALVEAMKTVYFNYDKYDLETISLDNRRMYSTEEISQELIDLFGGVVRSRNE